MLRVGLTGGIGSGKSVVCSVFAALGVPVYNADLRTKLLYSSNSDLKIALKNRFGEAVYQNDTINKPLLAGFIFSNPADLLWLNELVHPIVFKDYENWCIKNTHVKYTVKEAAILFESGSFYHVHKTVGVISPIELRIKRLLQRDNSTLTDIKNRMDKQLPEDVLKTKCDYIIYNDLENSIIKQVLALHAIFNS